MYLRPAEAKIGIALALAPSRSERIRLKAEKERVDAVCPSLTRTGMTEDMMDDKKLLAKFAGNYSPVSAYS